MDKAIIAYQKREDNAQIEKKSSESQQSQYAAQKQKFVTKRTQGFQNPLSERTKNSLQNR